MIQGFQSENIAVVMQHISKKYGKRKVLDDISFQIPEGKIFGLLGPSGCGKSTTVKILAGILREDCGQVEILEKKMPDMGVKKQIGYMTQSAALYPTLTAEENLEFFGKLYGMNRKQLIQRVDNVLELVHLTDERKKAVHTFSGGMKQRLSLAATLLANPRILILDEPTVGIDPVLRQEIWGELYKLTRENVTILVTTHVMDEAEKCNSIAFMRDGRILASGTPEEIQVQVAAKSLEEAFIYYCNSDNNQKEGGR